MRKATLVFCFAIIICGAGSLELNAQPSASIPRVGVLVPESRRAESQVIKGLRDQLRELDYREGKNILFEIRDAKGDRNALKPMVSALVSQKVRIIFTSGTRATWTAKQATTDIPIVFSHPADPVALGLVKNMARPGENITGVAGLSLQMTERRLEALKEIVTNLRRVHIIYDSNNKFSLENFNFAQKIVAKSALEVVAHPIKSAEELKSSVGGLQNRDGDALFHVPDDLVESEADFIFDTARQKKLPTMFNEETWAIKGALAAYGPSYYEMGRQAARLIESIIKGANPGTLPIQPANKFDLIVNYRTASFIGLTLSRDVLKKADKVIR